MELKPHQQANLARLRGMHRGLDFSDPGTGKTLTMATLLRERITASRAFCGGAWVTVTPFVGAVVGPPSALESWRKTLDLLGVPWADWKRLRRGARASVYLISAGLLSHARSGPEALRFLLDANVHMLVVDEAHESSVNTRGDRLCALWEKENGDVPFVYFLTATPVENNSTKIFRALCCIYPRMLWRTLPDFEWYFFEAVYEEERARFYGRAAHTRELNALLRPVAVRTPISAIAGAPRAKTMTTYFSLDSETRNKYTAFIEQMFPDILVRGLRRRQLFGGCPEQFGFYEDTARRDHAVEIVNGLVSQGEYVVVVYEFTASAEELVRRLDGCPWINGATTTRRAVVDAWKKGPPSALVLHRGCSPGLDGLQHARVLVNYEPSIRLDLFLQANGRIARIGGYPEVLVINIMDAGNDSIDEKLYRRLTEKTETAEQIKEGI